MGAIPQTLDEVRRRWGPWTAHNIEIEPGVFTIEPNPAVSAEWIVRNVVQNVSDILRQPLHTLRGLDLGCLEGGYSIELARHGTTMVGVDAREANLAKARFAASKLALDNVEFINEDVRNLNSDTHGTFDVILCIGILYHLDAPDVFRFLQALSTMCTGMLIIDTHVSVIPNIKLTYEDHPYWGWYFEEHPPGTSAIQKVSKLWASLDNDKSFWFTRPSLVNFLNRCGFSTIVENMHPALANRANDRAGFIALPGVPVPYHSAPSKSAQPPPWREDDRKFWRDPYDPRISEQRKTMQWVEGE